MYMKTKKQVERTVFQVNSMVAANVLRKKREENLYRYIGFGESSSCKFTQQWILNLS